MNDDKNSPADKIVGSTDRLGVLRAYVITADDIYALARGCRVFGDDEKLREPTRLEIALAQYVETHNKDSHDSR